MNQRQRGHKTQGTYSIEDMLGEGLSAPDAQGTLFHLQSVLKSIPFLRIGFGCKKDFADSTITRADNGRFESSDDG